MPYNPMHDRVEDPTILTRFMATHPLAQLITHDGRSPDCNLIPLTVVDDPTSATGRTLRGHVARGNQVWTPGHHQGVTMAVFGPVENYISPTWYPSKQRHHRVVPTWNYLVVTAWGPLNVHDDPQWVRGEVARLTTMMESHRDPSWRMAQAPRDYLADMLDGIVGISLPIQRLEGRFKVSAHRDEDDRMGARDGVARDRSGRGWQEVAQAMSTPPRTGSPRQQRRPKS